MLFDLDDTLVDREATLRRFAELFAVAYGGSLATDDAAELHRLIRMADRGDGRPRAHPGGSDQHDVVVAEELTRVLPWRVAPSVAELAGYWTAQFPRCSAPSDGLQDTFAWLRSRGLRTGIVTNGVALRQMPKIQVLALEGLLDVVIISEEVGVRKPDRRIFQLALDAICIAPQHAWFVGDNPVADVRGAADAGLRAVWFRRGAVWPSAHPEPGWRIDNLGELVAILGAAIGQSEPTH